MQIKYIKKNKRYEFRKTKPKKKIQKIIIYTTNPVKKITGEAKVKNVIEDTPENIFKMTKEFAGISKEEFFKYYKGTNKAIAYELEEVKNMKKQKL